VTEITSVFLTYIMLYVIIVIHDVIYDQIYVIMTYYGAWLDSSH